MIRKSFVETENETIARIMFVLPDSIWAETIHLVGDFNNWNRASHPFGRDSTGKWTLTIELELGRAYQFRYLCDDKQWMNDWGADAYVYNPYGSDNFVVITDPNFRRLGQEQEEERDSASIRSYAEERLREQPEDLEEMTEEEAQRLIRELQIHQIEWEVQSERLRRTQQELRESNRKYTDLYDFAPIGYFTLNENGLIIEANLTGATLLGVKKDALLKKSLALFIAAEDQDKFHRHCQQVLATRTRQTGEFKLLRKNGKQIHVQFDSIAVQDSQEVYSQIRTAISDITARKEAEEALLMSELQHRTTIDALSDVLHVVDKDMRFIITNTAFQEWCVELERDPYVIGQNLFAVFPFLSNKVRHEYQKVFNTGKSVITEEYGKIGSKAIYTETRKIPVFEGDKVMRVITIIRDITERKRAEDDLLRRNVQLQTAAEVSRAASSILDTDKLVAQSVELIRERFGLYYVGLFLVNAEQEYAVLRAGTGWPGQQMVTQEHKLKVGGASMIGQCVAQAEARIALDVGEEAVRFDNPLLPRTRSEMALPLRSRGQIIGALTVQSTEAAAFDEASIAVMQAMADQVATAIDNARLYTSVQKELTERKRVEGALRQAERKLDRMLQTMVDAVIMVDLNGRVTYANRATQKVLGLGRDEIVGEFYDAEIWNSVDNQGVPYPPEDLALSIALREEREVRELEHGIIAKGEGLKWISVNAAPLLDEEGRIYGAVASFRDITARKQAIEALRESEERFSQFMDQLPAAAFIKDKDSRTIYANRHMIEKFEADKWLGKTAHAYFPADVADMMIADDRRALKEGLVVRVEAVEDSSQYPSYYETRKFPIFREDKPPLVGGVAMDITARKRAEDALRESEARYRELVETMTEGLIIGDANSTLTYANESFCRMLGYSQDEIIGRKFAESLDEYNRSILEEQLAKRRRGERESYELVINHKDGSKVHTIISPNALFDTDGNFAGSFAVVTDITEREQTEAALRESEERFRTVADFTYDWEYWRGLDGDFIYVSPSCKRITGYTAAEFFDDSSIMENIIHPVDREFVVEHLKNELHSQETWSWDFRIITREDNERWLHHVCRPVYNDQGDYSGCRASNRDITERKLVEEALRDSEARYRKLFERANDAIFLENDKDEIIDVNQRAADLLGYSREELLQIKVPELQAPEVRGQTGSVIAQELAQYNGVPFEAVDMHRDGTRIPVEISTSLIAETDDGPNLVLSIVRDITERKLAEEALRRREDILKAVGFVAATLLQPVELKASISAALERLGKAANVSRAYLFENFEGVDGKLYMRMLDDWVAPGIVSQVDKSAELQRFPYWARWEDKLKRGEAIRELTRDMPPEEQEFMKTQNILSLLAIPVFVESQFYGLVGFDECTTERRWLDAEVEALRTAARALGAALQREWAKEALEAEQQRLFAVLDMLPVSVCLRAADYSIRFTNRYFCEHFGEPGHKLCYEIMRGRDEPCPDCPSAAVLDANNLVEWEWISSEGRTYQFYGYPFTDVDGSPLTLELGMDITESKQVARVLQARYH